MLGALEQGEILPLGGRAPRSLESQCSLPGTAAPFGETLEHRLGGRPCPGDVAAAGAGGAGAHAAWGDDLASRRRKGRGPLGASQELCVCCFRAGVLVGFQVERSLKSLVWSSRQGMLALGWPGREAEVERTRE